MQAKGKRNENVDRECYNCKKKGHLSKDCWAKGGGMEGKGPRGRKGLNREEKSNQAEEVNDSLNDVAYMAGRRILDSKHSWYLDSGMTSHICNNQEAYTKFIETDPVPIRLAVWQTAWDMAQSQSIFMSKEEP